MTTTAMPTVSVLMPTYRQAAFIARAIGSLLDQTFQDFELVVVDDGSDDDTASAVGAFADPRIRYLRHSRNRGPGVTLNVATRAATGEFLAYLPSDDYYDPEHLERCVDLLRDHRETYLAYAGVRWVRRMHDVLVGAPEPSPTLYGCVSPWNGGNATENLDVRSGNYLALVQVVHRRGHEAAVRWRERSEVVTDALELDFWTGLLATGARFSYTGSVTCEWGDHPDQHHKIISGRGAQNRHNFVYGLSRYRQFYLVPSGERLNWQPVSHGIPVDEDKRYYPLRGRSSAGTTGQHGLKILLTGALGFNPEHLLVLEQAGHQLAGLWSTAPHFWETAGPLPFGNVLDIPHDDRWRERVRHFAPDVIYGLLNWPSIPLLHEVMRAGLAPFVVHMQESPAAAMQVGYWPMLRDLMLSSAGRIFISEESERHFETVLSPGSPFGPSLVMNADLPNRQWMTDEWSPPRSDLTPDEDEVHTVCTGRLLVTDIPMNELANRKIHVHHYGATYRQWAVPSAPAWVSAAEDSPFLHLHGDVNPQDWTRELSQYDAGWLHVFTSVNQGHIRGATWPDLNLQARIGTYAAAGLPWIMRANRGHIVGVERLATDHDVGIAYSDVDDLARRLREEKNTRQARQNMRAVRDRFTFDHHLPRLIDFFASLQPKGADDVRVTA
ncbi:glycosyltransferase [Amycolatopsis sp. NPDC049868]|uniref:glycosyltransferase n=1 Tax=Amycolatopsis sp. NPDC049868 TaxID=3363934 RepID=UPI0037B3CB42